MREIKFRGKSIETGEWVYGFFIGNYDPHQEANVLREHFIWEGLGNIGRPIPVNPDTVGQYTGLKDKNGKEIYEGDIVCPLYVTGNPYGLILHDESFVIRDSDGDILMIDETVLSEVEVSGTIHDNPELLK